ncbi:unnamed protein product [Lathyrus sativus]|nr:unnamed protein product [Lathyrus sativus]
MEFVGMHVVGNRFTWFKSNGSCKSNLDKLILTEELINKWNIVVQHVRDRDISDHIPMWIKANNVNCAPKSFKVFNCWYDHPEFLEFAKNEWNSIQVDGSVAHILKEKFKVLRTRLRW